MTPKSSTKPVVAIPIGHYLPGSKGGGPIRSIANLVAALGDEFDFRILTLDHDLGDSVPYSDVLPNEWVSVGQAQVRYLSAERANGVSLASALTELNPDLVYCQSYFSPLFSIRLRLLRRTGRLRSPLLIAPRGEFSSGALALKARKKRLFLALGRASGLDRGVVWHATAPEEAEDIRRTIGLEARILVAPPIPTPDDRPLLTREKTPGRLEVVFVSRISPKKNLLGAIDLLAGIPGVTLTVTGPKEDPAYWEACLARARAAGVEIVDGGAVAGSEVRGAFERGHVLLFPTLGENYGHVVAESLGAGTPVLVSDRTPWRDLRAKGIGEDLPLDRPDLFRAAIERFRAMDGEEFAAWSVRAYEMARERRQNAAILRANRDLLRAATVSHKETTVA